MRDYYDERWHGDQIGPDDFVSVPTAVSLFANELSPRARRRASGPSACTTSGAGR